jgi:dihydrofolate synthase/folylpolyglutamate synthase
VVAPAVTCITSIEREHTDRLGNTLAAIAGEKAGIVKAGVPCVVGPLAPEALERVEARAHELGAPLARLGHEFDMRIDPAGGPSGEQVLHYAEAAGFELVAALPLLGEHQATNAALALACVRRLAAHDDAALTSAVRSALARAVLPGRCEVVQREPWIVIDSAHTAASAEALAAVLAGIPGKRRHLVLSLSADKDLAAILPVLLATADEVTLTRADRNRSLPPDELAQAVREVDARIETRIVEDPAQALRSARAALAADGRLCAAGSFYLAGIARRVLGPG